MEERFKSAGIPVTAGRLVSAMEAARALIKTTGYSSGFCNICGKMAVFFWPSGLTSSAVAFVFYSVNSTVQDQPCNKAYRQSLFLTLRLKCVDQFAGRFF